MVYSLSLFLSLSLCVQGLSSILTKNVKEIEGVMSLGNKNRSVG